MAFNNLKIDSSGNLQDTSKSSKTSPQTFLGVNTGSKSVSNVPVGGFGSGPNGEIQGPSNTLSFSEVPNDPRLTLGGGVSTPSTGLVTGGNEVPPAPTPEPTVRVPNVEPEIDAPELSESLTGNSLDISDSVNTVAPSSSNIEAQAASITQTYFDSIKEKESAQSSSAAERQAAADRDLAGQKAEQDIDKARAEIDELDDFDTTEQFKTELEKNLEALGVDMSEFTSLATEVGKLQGDLQRLNAEELRVTEDARLRGESSAFASGQVAQERHRFAVERAGLSAELGARAALLQALQGNFELAQGMTKEIVDNAYLGRQTKLDNLNDFIDRNEDLLDSISKAEADELKEARKREETSLEEDKDNATKNISYMNSDPSAFRASGLTVSDITTMSNADFAATLAKYSTKGTSGAATGKVYTETNMPGEIRNSVISDLQNKTFALANGELTIAQLSQLYPEVNLAALTKLYEQFYDYEELIAEEGKKELNWFQRLIQ